MCKMRLSPRLRESPLKRSFGKINTSKRGKPSKRSNRVYPEPMPTLKRRCLFSKLKWNGSSLKRRVRRNLSMIRYLNCRINYMHWTVRLGLHSTMGMRRMRRIRWNWGDRCKSLRRSCWMYRATMTEKRHSGRASATLWSSKRKHTRRT
jgi:hypothetical protein